MLKKLPLFIFIGFLVYVALWCVLGELGIFHLIYADCYNDNLQNPQVCEQYHFFFWIVHLMDGHEGFFVGAFTGVLALFTYYLNDSTTKLWKAGEDQSKRISKIESAIISVTPNKTNPVEIYVSHGRGIINFEVINHGKTPAIITAIKAIRVLCDNAIPESIEIVEPIKDNPNKVINWEFVNGLVISYESGSVPLPAGFSIATPSAEVINGINSGRITLCIAGTVLYKDIFGEEHESSFCWYPYCIFSNDLGGQNKYSAMLGNSKIKYTKN